MKESGVFASAYRNFKCMKLEHLMLFYSNFQGREVGFTVSKKIGNAVVRNRVKRRLKSNFIDISDSLKDGRYIFVARPSISNIRHENIKESVDKLTTKYIAQ